MPPPLLTRGATTLQIRRIPHQGAGRGCRATSRHTQAHQVVARVPRRATLQRLKVSRRRLADGCRGACVKGQRYARGVIPTVPARRDERDYSPHGWLRAPAAVHVLVHTVAPTTYFVSPGSLRQTPRGHSGGAAAELLSRGNQVARPSFLRLLYNTWTYKPTAMDRNALGITSYHEEYASFEDLKKFMNKYRSDALNPTFAVEEVNSNGYDLENPGEEANLDMQYAQAMAWPTRHVFYSVGGLPAEFIPDSLQPVNNNEPFLDWLNYMSTLESVPQMISTSYSGNEQTFPLDYAKSICDLFATLGSRGVSLLIASGNEGVGGGDCKKNDGSGIVRFQPIFPPTCAFDFSPRSFTVRRHRCHSLLLLVFLHALLSSASEERRDSKRLRGASPLEDF